MLDVEGIRFRYEDMDMAFTLHAAADDCLAIIGPSGAGKSTLLSLIAGFDKPYAGRILIDGQDVTQWPPARRPVTTLFQEHNLFSHLNVADNVGLGIHPGLKLTAQDRERITAALAEVGLAGLEKRLPAQLSGGQRQRTALARSLVRRRPILLLDEPFAALGPALRREMLDLVNRIRREQGLTVLFVSHHPEDARYAAAHTAFIHNGTVLAIGATDELLTDTSKPALQAYLGSASR